jgi:myo-inositol catabolism protein IolC
MSHKCPGGCGATLRDDLLACRPHWWKLPKHVRDDVWATKDLPFNNPARQDALVAAVRVYGDAAPPEWQALLPATGG